MNLVIISLKMVYSFNPFMSLNICVNLEISIINTYAEILDRFRLLNNVQTKNTSVYYANNALYSETKNKHFQQYTKTLYSMNFVISRQYITLYYLFILLTWVL